MNVYSCLLWGFTPEELVSSTLVGFIENMISRQRTFTIKFVSENTNPADIKNPFIGYYPHYGMAYISHPSGKNGLIGVDIEHKRLLVASDELPFFRARDSVVYTTLEQRYVREDYKRVLEDFIAAGYTIFSFVPREQGDYLSGYRSFQDVLIGAELSLESLL